MTTSRENPWVARGAGQAKARSKGPPRPEPIIALVVTLLLAGCVPAVTVRAPLCELQPLQAATLEGCDLPAPMADGQLETFYLQNFVDTALIKCWAKRFNNLKAQMLHRDEEFRKCQKIGQPDPGKPWWKP